MNDQIDQYTVDADINTGEWYGEPVFVSTVNLGAWHERADSEYSHFDTYEVPAGDGIRTVTRAIEVRWIR